MMMRVSNARCVLPRAQLSGSIPRFPGLRHWDRSGGEVQWRPTFSKQMLRWTIAHFANFAKKPARHRFRLPILLLNIKTAIDATGQKLVDCETLPYPTLIG